MIVQVNHIGEVGVIVHFVLFFSSFWTELLVSYSIIYCLYFLGFVSA